MADQPVGVDDDGEFDDFDAWLKSQAKGKRVQILGQVVTLPEDVPLGYRAKLARLGDAKVDDEGPVKELVGLLYGEGALDRWTEADVGIFAFQVLLGYGDAHLSGVPLTFDQVAEKVKAANAAADELEGKAAAAARARQKKPKRRKGPGGGSPAAGP